MPADISSTDLLAFGLFMAAWCGYTLIMDHLAHGLLGLNQHLKVLRIEWVRRMLDRDNRIMDTALVGHTIHSVTFFASTSMLILAGLVGMLGAVDTAHTMLSQFSFATPVSREFFELKILLLFGIFIFGFMKFTWAIRQYNYCCAMMGSAPMAPLDEDVPEPCWRQLQRWPAGLLLRSGGTDMVRQPLRVHSGKRLGGDDPGAPPVHLPDIPGAASPVGEVVGVGQGKAKRVSVLKSARFLLKPKPATS
jgi:hypothetical protein